MSLLDVHVAIPGSYEPVAFRGKGEFANVTNERRVSCVTQVNPTTTVHLTERKVESRLSELLRALSGWLLYIVR